MILPPVEWAEEDLEENHCPFVTTVPGGLTMCAIRHVPAREAQTDGPKHSRVSVLLKNLRELRAFGYFITPRMKRLRCILTFSKLCDEATGNKAWHMGAIV